MQLLKSKFVQKNWPLLLTLLWLVFAASTRVVGVILDADQLSCGDADNGPYWLFVTYSWPAYIATLMTVPILLLIAGRMGRDRMRDWKISFRLGMVVVMLAAQIIACHGALLSLFFAPAHQSSLRIEQHVYHLATCTHDLDYSLYILYECDFWSVRCSQVHDGACILYGGPCATKMRVSSDGNALELLGNSSEGWLGREILFSTYPLDD